MCGNSTLHLIGCWCQHKQYLTSHSGLTPCYCARTHLENVICFKAEQCVPYKGETRLSENPNMVNMENITFQKISTQKNEISLCHQYGNHQYTATTGYFSVIIENIRLCNIIHLQLWVVCWLRVCTASKAAASYLLGNIIVDGRSTVYHFNLDNSVQLIPTQ